MAPAVAKAPASSAAEMIAKGNLASILYRFVSLRTRRRTLSYLATTSIQKSIFDKFSDNFRQKLIKTILEGPCVVLKVGETHPFMEGICERNLHHHSSLASKS